MTTKLTLSIDKDVIEKAKKYTESHHRSLSDVIESFLKSLMSDEKPEFTGSGTLKSLRGSFKAHDDDYKNVLEQEISRKHGLKNK